MKNLRINKLSIFLFLQAFCYFPLFNVARVVRFIDLQASILLLRSTFKKQKYVNKNFFKFIIITIIPILFYFIFVDYPLASIPYLFRVSVLFVIYSFITSDIKNRFDITTSYFAGLFLVSILQILKLLPDNFTPEPSEIAQSFSLLAIYSSLCYVFNSNNLRQNYLLTKLFIYNSYGLLYALAIFSFKPKSFVVISALILFLSLCKYFYSISSSLFSSRFRISKLPLLIFVLTLISLLSFIPNLTKSYKLTLDRAQGVITVVKSYSFAFENARDLNTISDLGICLQTPLFNEKELSSNTEAISFQRKSLRYICQFKFLISNWYRPLGVGIGAYPSAASESFFLRSFIEFGFLFFPLILYMLYKKFGPAPFFTFLLLSFFNDGWYTQYTMTLLIVLAQESIYINHKNKFLLP